MTAIKARSGKIAGASVAVVMAAAAFIQPQEGFDPVAVHHAIDPRGIITIGNGSTQADIPGLKIGDTITRDEAQKLLAEKLAKKYIPPLRICIPGFDKMPLSRQVAFIDAAYNLGYGGVCRSSMVRKINAGDVRGAADAFLLYDKVNGRRASCDPPRWACGVYTRRRAERALMLRED